MSGVKIAVIFDNFGPYHLARLRAAAAVCNLLAVEVTAKSAEYEWKSQSEDGGQRLEDRRHWNAVTLMEAGTGRGVSSRELTARLNQALDDFQPQAVFIPGWSSKAAFAALSWCARAGVPAIAMSESTEGDERRSAWREAAKRRIVGLFSAALVGGTPHKDYMVQLGMAAECVFPGYDAVDNRYFEDKVREARSAKCGVRSKDGMPGKYFLASARFIEKKNLPRLIEAYALYREKAEKLNTEILKAGNGSRKSDIWNLVLLGDGTLKSDLCRLISDLSLQDSVLLPGFKQYPDLPAYYGLASVFIHASTTEQWGLVVNEAMASGLPVLVSNRCGCAADLVQEGRNGFTFDPYNIGQLADLMLKISTFYFPLSAFGSESKRIIADWGPERFAAGLKSAVDRALEAGPKKPSLPQRAMLAGLMRC